MLIDRMTEAEGKIERILGPCRAGSARIYIVMIINSRRRAQPRSQTVVESQAGSPCFGSRYACRGRVFESIAAGPSQRMVAAHVSNHTVKVWTGRTPIVFQRAKCIAAARVND